MAIAVAAMQFDVVELEKPPLALGLQRRGLTGGQGLHS